MSTSVDNWGYGNGEAHVNVRGKSDDVSKCAQCPIGDLCTKFQPGYFTHITGTHYAKIAIQVDRGLNQQQVNEIIGRKLIDKAACRPQGFLPDLV